MNRADSYLVDTDIIIYWLKNRYPRIDERIKEVGSNHIFISSITVAELYFGAYNSSKPDENLELINELLSEINILNFDAMAGEQFGKIKSALRQAGKILSDSDIFIAATAISNNMVLVSNNEKHFQRVEDLSIQNWAK